MTDLFHPGAADLAEDAKRLLQELDRDVPGVATTTADCRPPLDVFETPGAIEIVVDIPGVAPDTVRVVLRRNTLLVVGAKLAASADARARFHLAERSYGRFARAIRIGGAFDGARARATTSAGELRVVLPVIEDRRGQMITVAVERA